MLRTALGALLAVTVVSGCGSGSGTGRTPYPLPPGAVSVALPTQPPYTSPIPSPGIGCPGIGPAHVTVVWDKTAHSVSFTFDEWSPENKAPTILWPRGFSAREYQGRLELVAPDGKVVARDSEEVPNVIGLGPELVCMVDGVQYQPVP
jgi:hypothetical protein